MTRQYGVEYPSETEERKIKEAECFEDAWTTIKAGIYTVDYWMEKGEIIEPYVTNILPRLTWKLPNGEWY